MNRLDPFEIGWLAGIIDGEGCISHHKYTYRISVSMTDKDIVDRLLTVTGVGSVFPKKVGQPHYKPCYTWQVNSPVDVMHILASITPLMSERRRETISKMADSLNERREKKRRYQEFCTKGHLRTEENTYHTKNGYMMCGDCSKLRYIARKPALSG